MEVRNEHIYERLVIRHEPYIEVIEAAMMQVAIEVYGEDVATPGHDQRAHIALNIFLSPTEAARFTRFFAWLAIFNPTIRGQVFHGENDIRPESIDGVALRTLIKNAWNIAANVQPESE